MALRTVQAQWKPQVGSSFMVAYGMKTLDNTYTQAVVDVDGELLAATPGLVASIHGGGTRILCYFSAGSYEDWREDKAKFTSAMLGSPLDGWPGEWWLDIRQQAVRDIMTARMQRWAALGCDAVDPDNIDGYSNANGLGLTAADAIDYIKFLASTAHSLGLSVGLKNNIAQVAQLEPYVDFAFNEQCVEYQECDQYAPMTSAGKMVFGLEYNGNTSGCAFAQLNKVSSVYTDVDLTGAQTPCDSGSLWRKDSATFNNGVSSTTEPIATSTIASKKITTTTTTTTKTTTKTATTTNSVTTSKIAATTTTTTKTKKPKTTTTSKKMKSTTPVAAAAVCATATVSQTTEVPETAAVPFTKTDIPVSSNQVVSAIGTDDAFQTNEVPTAEFTVNDSELDEEYVNEVMFAKESWGRIGFSFLLNLLNFSAKQFTKTQLEYHTSAILQQPVLLILRSKLQSKSTQLYLGSSFRAEILHARYFANH
ncbi:hypothetical protein HK100_003770 [Physocladia obscura]|uniref:alpha-galactosidase n=1 Tax=Physocladia obscura TaxID=109957 RepID=A0AAD5T7L4_9FUNG|nr:hypothetical protein HK100_003770 [Physocladia obscura]